MKKERKKLNKESNDLKSLGSELGSFGLEPPQIYRPDQRERFQSTAKKKVKQTRNSIKKKPVQLSKEELAKRRQQKKKLRLALSIIGIIFAVIIVMVILSLTVFFKIDTIKVTGNEYYTKKEITAVLPIEKQKNMFIADTDSAVEKLEHNLPYIYSAEIKRKIPSTIIVNVTETPRIYARQNVDETYILLDDNFKVLETAAIELPENVIMITKAKINTAVPGEIAGFASKKKQASLSYLSDAVKNLQLEEATGIYSTDVNNNYIIYDNRITIKIGDVGNIENKLYSALAAIEKLNESDPEAVGEITSMGGKQVYFTEQK